MVHRMPEIEPRLAVLKARALSTIPQLPALLSSLKLSHPLLGSWVIGEKVGGIMGWLAPISGQRNDFHIH